MMPMGLKTTHLSMRPFRDGDAVAVYNYWQSDPGWVKFNESVPSGFTLQDAQNFVNEMQTRDRQIMPHWALLHDNHVMGVISLTLETNGQLAYIGYGIHAGLRGRGLIPEAVGCVLDTAFEHYQALSEIRARTHADNSASLRVLEKLGFTNEPSNNQGIEMKLLRRHWIEY